MAAPPTTADGADFLQLFASLQSSDNNSRREAERLYDHLLEQRPDLALLETLNMICTVPDAVTRQQAVLIMRTALRPFLNAHHAHPWGASTEETRMKVKTGLMNHLCQETDQTVVRSLCPLISDLASAIMLGGGQWTELNTALFQWLSSGDARLTVVSLKILTELAPRDFELLFPHMSVVSKVVSLSVLSQDATLRLEAIRLICAIFSGGNTKAKGFVRGMQGTVEPMMQSVAASVKAKEDHYASDVMQNLIDVADQRPTFFSQSIQMVVDTSLHLCEWSETPEDVKHLTVEFLLTLARRAKLVLKYSGFVDKMVTMLMNMLLSVAEDPEWLDRDVADGEDDRSGNYDVAEGGVDRLASSMKTHQSIIPVVLQKAGDFIARPEWEYKFAGVIAISQTVEYIEGDDVPRMLGAILPVLLLQFQDPHHRVRFAACQAIGQIALDHCPGFQERHSAEVIPVLLAALNDPSSRVQSHAGAALVNFVEETHASDLMPYMDQAMETLFAKLSQETATLNIKEQAVTALAVFAGATGKKFTPYYKTFVPVLLQIVQQQTSEATLMLHGKIFECLSVIGASVPVEVFGTDGAIVLEAVLRNYADPSKDRIENFMTEAIRRLCKVMGDQFLPFAERIIAHCHSQISIQPVNLEDEEDPDMTLISVTENATKALKTSVIGKMENALSLMRIIGESLPQAVLPTIPTAMQYLLPILKYQFSEDLKASSIATIAVYLSAARKIADKTGARPEELSGWLRELARQIFENITWEFHLAEDDDLMSIDFDPILAELGGLVKCIKSCGEGVFDQQDVKQLVDSLLEMLKESTLRRKQARDELNASGEVDETELAELDESLYVEQTLRSTLLEAIASLMQTHSAIFLQVALQPCLEELTPYLLDKSDRHNLCVGIYFLDDLLEHLKEHVVPFLQGLLPHLLEACAASDAEVRQAACYGMNHAVRLRAIQACQIPPITQKLIAVLEQPGASNKDNASATDNAAAALATIFSLRPDDLGADLPRYVNTWLELGVPLTADNMEAKDVHRILIDALGNQNMTFVGANNEHAPRIVKALVQVYSTEFSNDSIDEALRQVVRQHSASLMSTQLTTKEARGMRKLMSDLEG